MLSISNNVRSATAGNVASVAVVSSGGVAAAASVLPSADVCRNIAA